MTPFTISGYSTALFSTWYFIEELDLLFDAGDGVTAALMQKSRKVRHVFISHADRDHLTGLLQFNQLNAREGLPFIYYPVHSGSFPALADFSARFDPHVTGTVWQGIAPGDSIPIAKDTSVVRIRNGHVPALPEEIKSLSYKVVRHKQKLREAYNGLPGAEIAALRRQLGDEAVMETVRETLLGYSGDTPLDDPGRWGDTPVLIHEATFLSRSDLADPDERRNKHSSLDEVMDMAAALPLQALILGHFSSRYRQEEIDEAILQHCRRLGIPFPVYRVAPGLWQKDILQQAPLWRGRSSPTLI